MNCPRPRNGWTLEIQLHRDRLYPSAWAPDGEHLDAWDHFHASLEDPIAFVVALKQMGGEDLFSDPNLAPRFRGIPRFYLYGLEQRFAAGRSNYYAWLALASHLKDPVAQWIATRDDGLQKVDEIFGYLFYDPEVKATPPTGPARIGVLAVRRHGEDVLRLGSAGPPDPIPVRPRDRKGRGRPERLSPARRRRVAAAAPAGRARVNPSSRSNSNGI